MIPQTNFDPPFNVTRASHIVLTTRDLAASKAFYTEVIGLVVTAEEAGVAYLRGVEEGAHHSLVLREAGSEPVCERIGLRVLQDRDIDRAKAYFDAKDIPARFVDVPFQGKTLHVSDPEGVPLEFCARMPRQTRLHDQFQLHKGAGALRLDHFQILVPDVAAASRLYTDLGFRISDYFVDRPGDERPLGIFLYRKSNPHDVVFLTRPGPVMHHFGYIVSDVQAMFRALDTAHNVGFSRCLERGPGRHGQGHVLYTYLRDPDGHRVEILPAAIQMGDIEDEPVRWHRENRHAWELPPPRSWLYEATRFKGVPVREGAMGHGLKSLEDFLLGQAPRGFSVETRPSSTGEG
jgi:catechol 2,3-dioxygenase